MFQAKVVLQLHKEKCPLAEDTPRLQISCDGVTETKSSSVSLDVYSVRHDNCPVTYPTKIYRALGRYKDNNPR